MAVSNGMPDFENMDTRPTNVNTPKKLTAPVAKERGDLQTWKL